MKQLPVLPGNGLALVPLRPQDITATYVGWLNDSAVVRFTEIVPGAHALADVSAYVADALASDGTAMWRILVDDVHVGNIRLSGIDQRHARASLALLIGDRDCHGRGVGTEAIRLVSEFAFDSLFLEKLSAGIYAGNLASRRAFEKAGFHVEATLYRHAFFEGARTDVLQMALFRSA